MPKPEGGNTLLRKLWVGYGRNREQIELMYSDLKLQKGFKTLGSKKRRDRKGWEFEDET